jgi:hypothetical protein
MLIAAAAAAVLALGACATATPYQPLQRGSATSGGYSEQQLEANRFQVSFSGNSVTDRRTVETYLLFRAAELTRQQGYDWFAIVDRQTDRNTQVYADPYFNTWGGYWGPSWRVFGPRYGGWSRWGYWGGGGGWGPGWGGGWGPGGYSLREVTRFEANAEIFMGRGPKPNDSRSFDASDVIQRLGPTIVRPGAA